MLKFFEILNLICWFRFSFLKLFYLDLVEKMNFNYFFFSTKYISGSIGFILSKSFNKKGIYNLYRFYNFLEKILIFTKIDFFLPRKPSFVGKRRKYRLKLKFMKVITVLEKDSFFFFFSYFYFVLFPRIKIKQLKYNLYYSSSSFFYSSFSQLGTLDLYNVLGDLVDYFDWNLNIFFKFNISSFLNLSFFKLSLLNNFKRVVEFNNINFIKTSFSTFLLEFGKKLNFFFF